MTRIILTRHGETQWNIEGRVQGVLNSSLTSKGISQAKSLGKRLKPEGITYLFTSDLERAVSTAKILNETLNIPEISLCKELREFSFGEWEGKAWSELRNDYPEVFNLWDQGPHKINVPGGETMDEVSERAWNFILKSVDQLSGNVLCFVTHGMTLQLLVKKALGIPIENWANVPWQHNTAVNIFDFASNGTIQPICIADSSHLD